MSPLRSHCRSPLQRTTLLCRSPSRRPCIATSSLLPLAPTLPPPSFVVAPSIAAHNSPLSSSSPRSHTAMSSLLPPAPTTLCFLLCYHLPPLPQRCHLPLLLPRPLSRTVLAH
ncbi:hypothetical protein BHE74_00036765 [Ensete ventricosum]|nr:hypothetical protein GW17_00010105 [Ensete ventricosum]RWW56516.1 hypothetical protein BHE74_00036765 [Ensete ventricosum]RZS11271.1 hypothetical protein BHM03_00042583 [Ensete ventricosum]